MASALCCNEGTKSIDTCCKVQQHTLSQEDWRKTCANLGESAKFGM